MTYFAAPPVDEEMLRFAPSRDTYLPVRELEGKLRARPRV
jgi:hypothetical protein